MIGSKFHSLNLMSVGVAVALVVCEDDYRKLMNEISTPILERHDFPGVGAAWTASYDIDEGCKNVVVAINESAQSDGITIACILVHEAQHVFQAYCKHIGERMPADEQSAYAVQAISEYLMREFLRQSCT